MTEHRPDPKLSTTVPEQEPFIPPRYLLILSALGLAVAVFVALTQPSFNVIGYGGLAFAILALLAWVLLAPQEAKAVLTGRTARFGGTSLIVTLIVLAALIAVYTLVRSQNLRWDLTESDFYSLTDESRQAIAAIGADPNIAPIKVLAFYTAAQASMRDQDIVLLDDYVTTSAGKISYEFVDPDRSPQQAQLYGVTGSAQIVVVGQDESGALDVENAERLSFMSQGDLTNAILKVAASGSFNAYFLTVQDGATNAMSVLKTSLTDSYDWNVRDVTVIDLASPQSDVRLNDPNLDGEVMIIPGGTRALNDDELALITDYVNAGGDLIIFAGMNLNTEGTSLATADNLSDYLYENFGLRFNNDVVVDPAQAFQSPLLPVATTLDSTSFITTNGVAAGQTAIIYEVPNSIEVAATPPQNVIVTPLVRSSADSYALSDLQAVLGGTIDKGEADPEGPFVLAASAENTQTGARVVLFSSISVAVDDYAMFQNVGNLSVAFNSLVWATNYDSYFTQITVQQQQRPQDMPIFADEQTLRNIYFVTIILLPLGVIALGIIVWWQNRERARAR